LDLISFLPWTLQQRYRCVHNLHAGMGNDAGNAVDVVILN
jgi:hypothetical protein